MLKKHGNTSMLIKYSNIYEYWTINPCAGGDSTFPFNKCLGKKVLEIGYGAGVDAERFIHAGADYTGIDLTKRAWWLTKQRIGDRGKLLVMNAEYLDFPDNTFDLVYSHGVIHHAVNPTNIVNEVYRVLKPLGVATIMLYGKPSIRYNLDIMFLRKILWYLRFPKYDSLRKEVPSPSKDQWISWNTDTLGCPLARVYTKKEAEYLFSKFPTVKSFQTNYGWFRKIIAIK